MTTDPKDLTFILGPESKPLDVVLCFSPAATLSPSQHLVVWASFPVKIHDAGDTDPPTYNIQHEFGFSVQVTDPDDPVDAFYVDAGSAVTLVENPDGTLEFKRTREGADPALGGLAEATNKTKEPHTLFLCNNVMDYGYLPIFAWNDFGPDVSVRSKIPWSVSIYTGLPLDKYGAKTVVAEDISGHLLASLHLADLDDYTDCIFNEKPGGKYELELRRSPNQG